MIAKHSLRYIAGAVLLVVPILARCALGQSAAFRNRRNARSQSAAAVQGSSDSKLAPVDALMDRSVDRSVSAHVRQLSEAATDSVSEEEKGDAIGRRPLRPAASPSSTVPQRSGSALHGIAPVSASPIPASDSVPGTPIAILDHPDSVSPRASSLATPSLSRSRWRQREEAKRIRGRRLQASLARQRGQARLNVLEGRLAQKDHIRDTLRSPKPPQRGLQGLAHRNRS